MEKYFETSHDKSSKAIKAIADLKSAGFDVTYHAGKRGFLTFGEIRPGVSIQNASKEEIQQVGEYLFDHGVTPWWMG